MSDVMKELKAMEANLSKKRIERAEGNGLNLRVPRIRRLIKQQKRKKQNA